MCPKTRNSSKKMTAAYGFEPHGVPTIFIGYQYWEGYSDQIGQEIEAAVKNCEENGCPDRGIGVIPGLKSAQPENQVAAPNQLVQQSLSDTIDLPVLGHVHLAAQSIWVSTALISFVKWS